VPGCAAAAVGLEYRIQSRKHNSIGSQSSEKSIHGMNSVSRRAASPCKGRLATWQSVETDGQARVFTGLTEAGESGACYGRRVRLAGSGL
jgi:hypothetical protein